MVGVGYRVRLLSLSRRIRNSTFAALAFVAFALRFAEFLTQLASAQAARIDSVDSQSEI